MHTRLETDLLGDIAVPADALYGAQTQRAIENFPIARQRSLGSYPTLVRALLLIKQSAAITNNAIGALPAEEAHAVTAAIDQLIHAPRPEQFPIHCLHGGGGTSANMNANEVVANLGEELLGGRRGQYRQLHPNDHVNLHQSTNDVYPSACRMAVILEWPRLQSALKRLENAYQDRAQVFGDVRRLARTCLQDAVPTTWGDFFLGWARCVARRRASLADAIDQLHVINLGGTIVGRKSDVPEEYLNRILPVLREVTGDPVYRQAPDLYDAAQNSDDLVEVSARLDVLARCLIKHGQDLRLLASGPEAGLGELHLPAVQPGSSIMPGKVNPVIPEFLIQLCLRVTGLHAACAASLDHADLDLNIWESLMVSSVLDSLELLENGVDTFTQRCMAGLRVDAATSAEHADTTMGLLTSLAQRHGYAATTALWKRSGSSREELLRLVEAEGLKKTHWAFSVGPPGTTDPP